MVTNDVVEEILSKLLVNDLLRCKSVCKSWYSLISSPSFGETYRKSMSNKEEYDTRRIAMITGKKYAHWEWSSYMRWSMQGSSNGLVCIYSIYENRIIVTNPWTREFRELAHPLHLPVNFGHVRCLGFGYDSSTDDYKVFMAICTGKDGALVHILSLKSNIWKFFGQINYGFNDARFDEYNSGLAAPGILFNGALHWFWLDVNYTGNIKVLIVSFDLAKEGFREIPQPDDSRYVWNYDYSLRIIEGSLCIFIKNRYPPCSIWVMKNYNDKPSWELLPITNYREMKDHAIHYMRKDTNQYRRTPPPTYFCDDNIRFSRSEKYISSPIFVQTLVSPYIKEKRDRVEEKEEW